MTTLSKFIAIIRVIVFYPFAIVSGLIINICNVFCRLSESDAGMLIMERGAPRGEHEFKVEVSDSLGSAICTVRVNISYIEPEHVRSSGSMRLTGMGSVVTAEYHKNIWLAAI